MQIGDIKSVKYWRQTYSVDAIRLTFDNMQKIAEFLNAEYVTEYSDGNYIEQEWNDRGSVGDWLVRNEDRYYFLSHDAFIKSFKTHAEEMTSNSRYAKIFQLVASAMNKQDAATYHGDQEGMDLVMIETVKKIIGEL